MKKAKDFTALEKAALDALKNYDGDETPQYMLDLQFALRVQLEAEPWQRVFALLQALPPDERARAIEAAAALWGVTQRERLD